MNGTGPNSSSPLDSPAAKVLAVVGTIARRGSASISAIADGLDLPLPTAHRICLELERLGYVQRVPGTRHWTVARATVDMAAAIIAAASGDALVQAILRRVTDEIGEMCSFAVQVGDENRVGRVLDDDVRSESALRRGGVPVGDCRCRPGQDLSGHLCSFKVGIPGIRGFIVIGSNPARNDSNGP